MSPMSKQTETRARKECTRSEGDRGARLSGRLGAALCVALGLAAAINTAAAAQVTVATAPSDEMPPPNLRFADDRLLLSLDEAIELALERNLSLSVERYNQEESRFGINEAIGIFDLNLSADINAFEENTPSASNLDGADVQEREGANWNLRLDQLFATGGSARLDFNNSRFESNSQFATLNPSFSTDLDLTLSHPLLRDAGRLPTERFLLIARTNLDISRENFELAVTRTIEEISDAYWTLVESLAQLEVAEESLELARQLHEQNKIRVEVGTLAPLELVQSEAGIATREEEIIRAQAAVGFSEDRVRQLLNLDRGSLWRVPVLPDTEADLQSIERHLFDNYADRSASDLDDRGQIVEGLIQTAFRERPELRSKGLSLENLERDVRYFKNQLLPRLDFSVTYGLNGVGGDVTNRDFFTGEIISTAEGGYSDALDQIADFEFEGWSVGLNFAMPVQNRTAKAQSAIANVVLDRGKAELRELELQVLSEVRDAARLLDTAFKAHASAEVSRRLAERNLEAEQKRYDNGMSTSFQVLEIQEDLTQARSREVTATAAYRKSVDDLYRAIGTLIDERGVQLAE